MSVAVFLATVVAGGVGAALRYVADIAVARWVGSSLPWGTLAINVTGSFALGLLAGVVTDAGILSVVGVGLLGGYTTFGSVAVASAAFLLERRPARAAMNTVVTLCLTIAAAAAGLWMGQFA